MSATFGLTPQGFTPKRLADIIASVQANLNAVTDPVSGETLVVDLNDNSVFSQVAGIIAEEIADCWTAAAAAYLQFDPLFNTGAGQSGTVQLNGLLRIPPTATVLNLQAGGTAGATIPAGSVVSTSDNLNQFTTNESVTIGSGGTVEVEATCTTLGAVVVADSAAMSVGTPVRGWTTVTCLATVIQGAAGETDEALRIRQQVSTSETSYRQIEAIYAAVLNVPGVTYCRVYQNNTITTDSNGIPAKSIAVVVNGGDNTAIAKELFKRVPVGVGYYGSTTVQLTDVQGIVYNVSFQRPIPVPIIVSVVVEPIDSSFPSGSYVEDIQNLIMEYAAGGPAAVGVSTGFENQGFPPGASVQASLLYTAVNAEPGCQIVSLEISYQGGSLGIGTLAIAWNQVAEFIASNISVTSGTCPIVTTTTTTTTSTTTHT
jgi:uncharacterized phage protein gp47/JayE